MEQPKQYYAFISYKREDEKWAKWLQDKLEHYKFPTNLNGRTDLPKNIRPTFRDGTDLSLGLLTKEINQALVNSEWLIVICSPRSAKSQWVCKEAQTFIDLGRFDHIIPFIIEGTPKSKDSATECYPEALLNLTGSQELLGVNINEGGEDYATVKVVARMFNLSVDALWQRYEREQRRKRRMWIAISILIGLLGMIVGTIFYQLNKKTEDQKEQLEEQKERLHQDSLLQARHIRQIQEDSISLSRKNDSIISQNSLILQKSDSLTEVISALRKQIAITGAEKADNYLETYPEAVAARALELLPDVKDFPDIVVPAEVEALLRESSYRIGKLKLKGACAKFSPDDKYIVTAFCNKAIIYNAETGDSISELSGHHGQVLFVEFSKDGKYIATASEDSTAIIWNVTERSKISLLKGHKSIVRTASFSPDGKYIVTSSKDGSAIIWNAITGDSIRTLKRHRSSMYTATFSQDGKFVLTADERMAAIWEMGNADVPPPRVWEEDHFMTSAVISPNGKYTLTCTSYNAVVRDIITGDFIRLITSESVEDNVKGVKRSMWFGIGANANYSPDGKYIVITDGNEALFFSNSGKFITRLKSPETQSLEHIGFSTNGKYIAFSARGLFSHTLVWSTSEILGEDEFELWGKVTDLQPKSNRNTLLITKYFSSNLNEYSKDGDFVEDYYSPHIDYTLFNPQKSCLLGVHSSANSIVKWNVLTEQMQMFDGGRSAIKSIAISPDGTQILTAQADSTISIWDVDTGASDVLGRLDFNAHRVVFSPDGMKIGISSVLDTCFVIYDKKMKRKIIRISGIGDHFSPDGRFVATTSHNIPSIWNVSTGEKVWQMPYKEDTIRYDELQFSPNGQYLLCGYMSDDFYSGLKIWDIKRNEIVKTFHYYDNNTFAAYSSNGNRIALGTINSGVIHILDTRMWNIVDSISVGNSGAGIRKLQYCNDDKWLMADVLKDNYANEIRLIDLENPTKGKKIKEFAMPLIKKSKFSPNGNCILALCNNHALILNSKSKKIEGFPLYHNSIESADISIDDKYVVTSSFGYVNIWQERSGKYICIKELKMNRGVVSSVLNPDGNSVLIIQDKDAIILNVEKGDTIWTMKGHLNTVNSAEFRRDGKYVVTASKDKTAKVWDIENQEFIETLHDNEYVNSASYSPNGKYIVTTNYSKEVKIWETESYKPVLTIKSRLAEKAFFMEDGRTIVGWGTNGVCIWDFPPIEELIDRTYKRVKNRKLTLENRRKLLLD